jgi:uncharacterized protein YdaU (DUF1376 family)
VIKPDAWMPLYIAAYRADTSRLTTEQHGAYLLILMDYWRNGPPPDDDEVLAQITLLSPSKWRAHRPKIQGFFKVNDGRWTQKRADNEMARARAITEQRSDAGKASAEKRWGKREDNGNGNEEGNEPITKSLRGNAPSPSPSQKTLTVTGVPPPSPEDQKPSDAASASPASDKPKRANGKEKPGALTGETWSAYCHAYAIRYAVDPVRNAKVNGMMARFCERVPLDEAPKIAAFFVQSNRGLYTSAHHAVDLLLRDAEGLRTEWATGHQGTETEARQADKTAATGNIFGKLIEEAEQREKIGAPAA